MSDMSQPSSGPPYAPTTAAVGGTPTVGTDVPILSVLLAFYVLGAVLNMTILQLNLKKGHKFIMSGALFGFCMARTTTCVLRIASATRPTNVRLAIAATILTAAGILIVYVLLFLMSLRILRATHPMLGWHPFFKLAPKILYALVGISLALVIAFTVLSFYTLDTELRMDAAWVQRAAITYLLVFASLPTVILLLSVLLPRPRQGRVENFGTGSIASKQIILAVALFFIEFIAGFRCGTAWAPPRPRTEPAWYDGKAPFYVIEFWFEIIILYLLIISRFDQRFWVPNGSSAPGDYHELGMAIDTEKEAESK